MTNVIPLPCHNPSSVHRKEKNCTMYCDLNGCTYDINKHKHKHVIQRTQQWNEMMMTTQRKTNEAEDGVQSSRLASTFSHPG